MAKDKGKKTILIRVWTRVEWHARWALVALLALFLVSLPVEWYVRKYVMDPRVIAPTVILCPPVAWLFWAAAKTVFFVFVARRVITKIKEVWGESDMIENLKPTTWVLVVSFCAIIGPGLPSRQTEDWIFIQTILGWFRAIGLYYFIARGVLPALKWGVAKLWAKCGGVVQKLFGVKNDDAEKWLAALYATWKTRGLRGLVFEPLAVIAVAALIAWLAQPILWSMADLLRGWLSDLPEFTHRHTEDLVDWGYRLGWWWIFFGTALVLPLQWLIEKVGPAVAEWYEPWRKRGAKKWLIVPTVAFAIAVTVATLYDLPQVDDREVNEIAAKIVNWIFWAILCWIVCGAAVIALKWARNTYFPKKQATPAPASPHVATPIAAAPAHSGKNGHANGGHP